jgi:hypothetical protein
MKVMIELINNMKIISKVTKEEECKIKECKIKFEPSIDLSFMKNKLDNNKSDSISIELNDNFSIILREMTIDKINFKYSHIDNKRPYTFDFYTHLNNEVLYHCIIDDVYVDHRYSVIDKRTLEIYLRTRESSKLILEKIITK